MCPRFYTGRGKHAKKIFFVKPNTHLPQSPCRTKIQCGSGKIGCQSYWRACEFYFAGTGNFCSILASICVQFHPVAPFVPAATPVALAVAVEVP